MIDAEPVGIDPTAAGRWIESLGIQIAEPLRFERIGLGQSNLTYLITDGAQRKWVLRRPPLGELLASAHDVVREARVLSALAGTSVPVPQVFGVCRDVAVADAPVVLMEYVDGLVVDRFPVAEALSASMRRSIGLSLARTLGRVHDIDLAATGLVDLASHKPYAQRQLRRWSAQWERSKTRELPLLEGLTRRLADAIPEQTDVTLVHGDFHLRNVIVSPDAGDVVAVLDWELCTLGDPLADLGSLLAYWREPGESTQGGLALSTVPGFPSRADLVRAYVETTGRDPSALGYWHALGLWKLAIIAEGVLRRALAEPQNKAASGTPVIEQIDAIIDDADEVAITAGI